MDQAPASREAACGIRRGGTSSLRASGYRSSSPARGARSLRESTRRSFDRRASCRSQRVCPAPVHRRRAAHIRRPRRTDSDASENGAWTLEPSFYSCKAFLTTEAQRHKGKTTMNVIKKFDFFERRANCQNGEARKRGTADDADTR